MSFSSYEHSSYGQPDGPQRDSRLLMFLGLGAAALVALCLAVVVWLFLVGQRLPNDDVPDPPAVPTLPVTAVPPTLTRPPTEVPPIGAATVTLPPSPTIPPAGAGNVDVPRLTTPPTVDGNLGDWPAAPIAASNFQVFSVAGWDGSADLTAVWHLGWTPSHLYVAVRVSDDRHVQIESGDRTYRGDSVEMQIDTDRAGDFAPRLSPDDYQFVLSPGDFAGRPAEAYRFRGDSGGGIPGFPGHSVAVAALPDGEGYTLEASIPWADIGVTPQAGLVLGLALNANDNDRVGEAVQEVMLSHVPTRTLTDPTGWGTMTLR